MKHMLGSDGERALETHIRQLGLAGYRREYAFAKAIGRNWRFDFAFTEQRVAVEVEGGTWSQGRHTRGSGFEDDCEKLNEAVLDGWRVLRVTTDMVDDGRAVAFLERALGAVGADRAVGR